MITMTIEYSPILETEVCQLPDIQWEALLSNDLYRIMFPKGATPALLDYTSVQARRHIRYPCVRFYKATDKDRSQSKLVAFAKWIIYDKERHPPEEGQWRPEEQRDPAPAEDLDIEVAKEWTPKLREMRRITMGGKPHCRESSFSYVQANRTTSLNVPYSIYAPTVLDTLHVLPDYQRRGIGASLVKSGTDIADAQGLQCYLEASPAGKRLYAQCGFQEVGEISIDLSKYRSCGGNYEHAVMVRPARRRP